MTIRLKFEPRDLWVGVYWKLTRSIESHYRRLDVYVCILPMLPIHITYEWGWREKPSDEFTRAAYKEFTDSLEWWDK